MEDIQLECVDCAQTYTCTVGEQEFFLDRQFLDESGRLRLPIRCMSCRRRRKQQRRQEDDIRAAMQGN